VITIDLAFVFQLVNFLLLMLVLNFLLYRPIRRVIAERDGEIAAARKKAVEVDREVQEQVAAYESRMREVRATVSNERAALKKEALVEEGAIIEKARAEAIGSLDAIKAQVAKEAAEARTVLQEQARALSRDICEKVLGRSL
jgi:F-type H+-transporting ATPase subunit b